MYESKSYFAGFVVSTDIHRANERAERVTICAVCTTTTPPTTTTMTTFSVISYVIFTHAVAFFIFSLYLFTSFSISSVYMYMYDNILRSVPFCTISTVFHAFWFGLPFCSFCAPPLLYHALSFSLLFIYSFYIYLCNPFVYVHFLGKLLLRYCNKKKDERKKRQFGCAVWRWRQWRRRRRRKLLCQNINEKYRNETNWNDAKKWYETKRETVKNENTGIHTHIKIVHVKFMKCYFTLSKTQALYVFF